MKQKELAEFVHNQIVEAGNYWEAMLALMPYLRIKGDISASITPLYMSLQQSFFITMFKIFDKNGEAAKQMNIYSLISIEDRKKIDKYNKLIDKMKWHRNKIYAHNTFEEWKFTSEESMQLIELLKVSAEICSHYSEDVYPNYYTSNINSLRDLLKYIENKIRSDE